MSVQRLRGWLSGLWAGMVLFLGGAAAPSLFAALDRVSAGRAAARLFQTEAYASLALAVLLIVVERRCTGARRAAEPARSPMSPELLLALFALFCTVAGYFAIQPMMEQARAGQGSWSFGALHAVSSAFFLGKGAALLVLAWRCAPR
ncbi:DUF4149 domain-containing protein [Caldimonas brevitalea]|uniref:Transmembrane protein n=1 Tax=Caldimonas brevitalea TaxID=413882 RepID=A0A0G3BLN6_9BURK|nr:DUF4149 domain-containing protein [Caldimonas brevitalea]AKJ28908.1 transmembrane protein [Caldimonas brevitalea]